MTLPNATQRIDELVQQLSTGLPKQPAVREAIIRDLATAQWRMEMAHEMELSFFESALAQERVNPETAALIAKHGDHILLGLALSRDAEGADTLMKILRYQAAAQKHLMQAQTAFSNLLALIRAEIARTTQSQYAKPVAQPAAATETVETARNAQCPCGSGLKYKRCCATAPPAARAAA